MFASARDLFESAREASRDAERIRLQLLAMRERAATGGGTALTGRIRSTPDPDRMGRAIGAMVDMEAALEERERDDYALIDEACCLLYGEDGSGGLDHEVPERWWADVLWWRYLDGATWEEVGRAVGYSPRRCFDVAQAALDIADRIWWGRERDTFGAPRAGDAREA